MQNSSRVASPHNTRKARTAPTVQASTFFVITHADEDNLITRRAQRLTQAFGLTHRRARLVADLAFGGGHA